MKEITHIAPFQAAWVASVVAVIASLVGIIVGTVIPSLVSKDPLEPSQVLLLLAWPLSTGAITFFTAALSCVTYNWVAAKFGGIRVELS